MKDTWEKPVITMSIRGKPISPFKSKIKKPHHVDMWYDRSIRMWTLVVYDKNGFQIDNAEYESKKENAIKSKKELEERYGITKKKVKK